MNFNFDDISRDFGGATIGKSSSPSHYTEEQIEEAKRRQKKFGGSFMDNLKIVAPDVKMEYAKNSVDTTKELTDIIKELNDSVKNDFGIKENAESGKVQDNSTTAEVKSVELKDNPSALEKFKDIDTIIKSKVFGQDDYIKRLIIAFKRPFVSERDDNDALNSIFISGPSNTGKHSSLGILVKEMNSRGIMGNGEIFNMDLSLYPTANEEKLFVQDLYNALQNQSAVIVFENFEKCNLAALSKLSELVMTGECKLQERYIMRNGQLVSVSNSLAGDTVGSLEAKGKYLIFLSDKNIDNLAKVMGAPFINALGDICTTKDLDIEALKAVSSEQESIFIAKCKKQLMYDVTVDDSFREFVISQTSKGRYLKGILDAYSDTLRALTELKLERDDLSGSDIILRTEDDNPLVVSGEEKIDIKSMLPSGYSGELEKVKEELGEIVGLGPVKDYIYSLEEYFGVQKKRREAGLKAGELNKHMIFTGNPGTGKTTIARIVSKYLKAIGVLTGGQLVEVSRGDLVGRYVGHTAPLVNQVIKSAIGGVLFIDEAYSLYRGQEDSFGLEAIDTLVKGIEDNRDNLIVILAGYSYEMDNFLEANSGLKSRFPNIIDFPDYTEEELLSIAHITAKSKGYVIDESAIEPLKAYFANVQENNAREAGNGRMVRNKIEEAILNQSRRLVAESDADMSLLILGDFEL